mmetsp:Transcript_25038/g.70377  ORF Transcript_25038/g.70377 Transcript_25038/m.70377 type:complete len:251 (+) Transcript_25038:295-1047(+)
MTPRPSRRRRGRPPPWRPVCRRAARGTRRSARPAPGVPPRARRGRPRGRPGAAPRLFQKPSKRSPRRRGRSWPPRPLHPARRPRPSSLLEIVMLPPGPRAARTGATGRPSCRRPRAAPRVRRRARLAWHLFLPWPAFLGRRAPRPRRGWSSLHSPARLSTSRSPRRGGPRPARTAATARAGGPAVSEASGRRRTRPRRCFVLARRAAHGHVCFRAAFEQHGLAWVAAPGCAAGRAPVGAPGSLDPPVGAP